MDNYELKEKERKLNLFYHCRNESIKKILKEYNYDHLMKHKEHLIDYVPQCAHADFEDWISERTSQRYKYILFTINFKPGITVEVAMKKFKKYIKKKWIKDSYSCMEWRDLDKGMHIHSRITLCDKKNPYVCKREVYNTFKGLVGSKQHVHNSYSNSKDAFKDYIDGLKLGKPKATSNIDNEMRKLYNVQTPLESMIDV